MVFLNSISQAQQINWGLRYLWDIKFLDPPIEGPFGDWFPATSVDLTLFSIQSYTFSTTIGQISVPQKQAVGDKPLTVTLYDDSDGTIEEWLEDWVSHRIFPKDNGIFTYVQRLDRVCGKVRIVRLNSKKQIIVSPVTGKPWLRDFYVYPEGDLHFTGESDNGIHSYTMTFKIAGIVEPTAIR